MTVERTWRWAVFLPTATSSSPASNGCRAVPRLHERRVQRAGTMSGGEQQMLAIGRALMSQPRLLLLDQPSLGLAPIIIQQIFDTIELAEQGMTIFLVEQNANQALKLADRGYVLENGHVVLEE
ncbi:ATP-binding cassette domain-containing protein [Escherichia coli]